MSFVQLFRDGTIEFYDSTFIEQMTLPPNNYDDRIIDINRLETEIMGNIKKAKEIFDIYDKYSPFVILLTLFDLKNVIIMHGSVNLGMSHQMIARQQIFFPPVIYYNNNQDIPTVMKPILDILWQAGGYSRSGNFKNGEWQPQ